LFALSGITQNGAGVHAAHAFCSSDWFSCSDVTSLRTLTAPVEMTAPP
jgi:hypothetical protein